MRRADPEMNFAIRYLTQYEYDADVVDNLNALRVKPHGNGRQRCDEFSVRLDPRSACIATPTTSAPRWSSSRSPPAPSSDHRRPRARQHEGPPEPPQATWDALRDPAYLEAGGEFLLQTDDAPGHPVLDELLATTRAASLRWPRCCSSPS